MRHFIGTDDKWYLDQAIQACDHAGTEAYLREFVGIDEQVGVVPQNMREMSNDLVAEWTARGEHAAAAAVVLLAYRVMLRLATRNVHMLGVDRDQLDGVVNHYLGQGLEVARNAGFTECEAAFTHLASEWFARVGDWEPACGASLRAFHQYSEVCASHARDEPALPYMRRSAEVAIHATEVAGHLGNEALAWQAWGGAKLCIDALGRRGYLDRTVALAVQGAFDLMAKLRHFRIAWELGEMALSTFRNLHAREPGPQSAYDLGVMVNQFAPVLIEEGRYAEVDTLLGKTVALLEEHFGKGTWWSGLAVLGGAYTNLAHNRRLHGEKDGLIELYARAMDCFRRAAYNGPDPTYTSHAYLVAALGNLGSAHIDTGNFMVADRAFDEADYVRDQIRTRAPHVPIPGEWLIDAARSNLLWRLDRDDAALALGERALRLVEAREVPSHERWMAKGPAEQLYASMFDLYARSGDPVNAFRCLRSLRSGSFASRDEPREDLNTVVAALHEAGRAAARPMVILCPQDLGDGRMRMGILDSDHSGLHTVDCSGFVRPARRMELLLAEQYEDPWARPDESELERAAEAAWDALPEEVRGYLQSPERSIVLICGDALWSIFPWEGLKTGPGPLEVLGMRTPLVRHASLDAGSFSALTAVVIGGAVRTAAVVCPWNAGRPDLPSARDEAEAVAGILSRNGYGSAAGPLLRTDTDATPEGMVEAIAAGPDVLHYCGHGMVRHGEEALGLIGDGEMVPFGRREVDAVVLQAGSTDAPPRPGLTVLNCCYGGRVRSHGGRREDLVAAMMRAGAAVVVASAMPLDDSSAAVLGVCIHHPAGQGDQTVANIVVQVRQMVAKCAHEAELPTWPTWSHITCHGNPLAVYRRGATELAGAALDADDLAKHIESVFRAAKRNSAALGHRIRELVYASILKE